MIAVVTVFQFSYDVFSRIVCPHFTMEQLPATPHHLLGVHFCLTICLFVLRRRPRQCAESRGSVRGPGDCEPRTMVREDSRPASGVIELPWEAMEYTADSHARK